MTSAQIEQLKLLVTTIGVIGALFAYSRWRAEMLAKDKYSVVRKFGMKFLELGDCLNTVRSYNTYEKEIVPLMLFLTERKNKKLEEAKKLLNELRFLNLELRLFQLDFEAQIKIMQKFTIELETANNDLYIDLTVEDSGGTRVNWEKIPKMLFAEEGDDFGAQIQAQVASLTNEVVSIMIGRKIK